jgi:hypothetical protein
MVEVEDEVKAEVEVEKKKSNNVKALVYENLETVA